MRRKLTLLLLCRGLDCLVVQDLFLNETAKFAHVFLPGTSFLEKDGTFINAERRINRVRPVMQPRQGKDEWRITQELSQAMGYPMRYESAAEIMDEIAALTPTFSNVSFRFLDEVGSVQWPCNDTAPMGTPIMHIDQFVRGKGLFIAVELVRDRKTKEPARSAAAAVVEHLREHGVLTALIGRDRNALKLRPPLVFEKEHADIALAALDNALSAVA